MTTNATLPPRRPLHAGLAFVLCAALLGVSALPVSASPADSPTEFAASSTPMTSTRRSFGKISVTSE